MKGTGIFATPEETELARCLTRLPALAPTAITVGRRAFKSNENRRFYQRGATNAHLLTVKSIAGKLYAMKRKFAVNIIGKPVRPQKTG